MLLHKDGKLTIGPHYQFRGEGQGMNQALLHLWYPLFQAIP